MGLQESAPNQPIKGSYFNAALCGVDFVNYGVDTKDGSGDPKKPGPYYEGAGRCL